MPELRAHSLRVSGTLSMDFDVRIQLPTSSSSAGMSSGVQENPAKVTRHNKSALNPDVFIRLGLIKKDVPGNPVRARDILFDKQLLYKDFCRSNFTAPGSNLENIDPVTRNLDRVQCGIIIKHPCDDFLAGKIIQAGA